MLLHRKRNFLAPEERFLFFYRLSLSFFSLYGIDLNFFPIFRKRSIVFTDFSNKRSSGSSNLSAFDLFFTHQLRQSCPVPARTFLLSLRFACDFHIRAIEDLPLFDSSNRRFLKSLS